MKKIVVLLIIIIIISYYYYYSLTAVVKNDAATSVEIPFKIVKKRIIVGVSVNERDNKCFIVDTGYTNNVITPAFQNQLNIKLSDTTKIKMSSAKQLERHVFNWDQKSFKISFLGANFTVKIPNKMLTIISDIPLNIHAFGCEIGGILGAEFLKHYNSLFQFKNVNTMTLYNHPIDIPSSSSSSQVVVKNIDYYIASKIFIIPLRLFRASDQKEYNLRALLDTGTQDILISQYASTVKYPELSRTSVDRGDKSFTYNMTGVELTASTNRDDRIIIGGKSFQPNIGITVSGAEKDSMMHREDIDALVGVGALLKCNLTSIYLQYSPDPLCLLTFLF